MDDMTATGTSGEREQVSDSGGYRSYVVRVWSRPTVAGHRTRAQIEDVQSGRQVELKGDTAAEISARISAAFSADAAEAGARPRPTSIEVAARRAQLEGNMILVVGATGSLGGKIVRGLAAQGRQVRILVRPGSEYQPLVELGCEPAIGDLKEPASLSAACEGVDTVVTTAVSVLRMPPDTIETVELGGYANLIDAARAAGVRHVVYTSALMADVHSPIPFAAAKAVTAERLMSSGMSWTVLAPDAFMDVWLAMVVAGPALQGREVTYVGSGSRVHQFVHSDDVAAIAIRCVGNPRARDRFIPIGGPAAISLRDAVATLERVLGRQVPQRGVAPGETVPDLPPSVVEMLAGLDAFDSRLDTAPLADEFGVRLTSVREWAEGVVPIAAG